MQDILWKGAIEDFFEEMLDYFFSDWADLKHIDLQKGFEFLDQELHSIYPERSKKRIADKLVKVYLKDGRERWFLVHIEIQGYRDEGFPKRMFQCYYRIKEKYNKEVMTLVILTDNQADFHPKQYVESFHRTRLEFHFDTFKLLEKSEEALWKEGNIFSYVMIAARRAIEKNTDDRLLLKWKIDVIKSLISSGYSKEKIRRMLVFVDRIVNFADEKVVKEYETQKRELLKIEKNMGIIEAIVQQSFQEGIEKGVQEGVEKGRKEGIEKGRKEGIEKGRKEGIKRGRKEGEYQKALKTAMNCLKKGLSVEDTASITELAIEEIRALAEKLKNS